MRRGFMSENGLLEHAQVDTTAPRLFRRCFVALPGTFARARCLIYDAAVAHMDDAIAVRRRVAIVRDHQNGLPGPLIQIAQ